MQIINCRLWIAVRIRKKSQIGKKNNTQKGAFIVFIWSGEAHIMSIVIVIYTIFLLIVDRNEKEK